MLIVGRDNKIYGEWFIPYKYATIAMIEKAFMKEQQYGYEVARKRLIQMHKAGLIRIYHDIATNKNIYMLNEKEIKTPSLHRLILLDCLAEMKYLKFDIMEYRIEKSWMDGKIRSDALAVFGVKNYKFYYFIEAQVSNNPSNLSRYDTLYETGEVQKYLGGNYPRVLYIGDSKISCKLKHTDIVQIDTKLNQFCSILL